MVANSKMFLRSSLRLCYKQWSHGSNTAHLSSSILLTWLDSISPQTVLDFIVLNYQMWLCGVDSLEARGALLSSTNLLEFKSHPETESGVSACDHLQTASLFTRTIGLCLWRGCVLSYVADFCCLSHQFSLPSSGYKMTCRWTRRCGLHTFLVHTELKIESIVCALAVQRDLHCWVLR